MRASSAVLSATKMPASFSTNAVDEPSSSRWPRVSALTTGISVWAAACSGMGLATGPAALEYLADPLAVGRVVVRDQHQNPPGAGAAARMVLQPHDASAHVVAGADGMQHVEKAPLVEGQLEHRRKARRERLESEHLRIARHG